MQTVIGSVAFIVLAGLSPSAGGAQEFWVQFSGEQAHADSFFSILDDTVCPGRSGDYRVGLSFERGQENQLQLHAS
jgi:hypothetical protein